MLAHRLGTKKLKRKNLIHVHQILQVCTRCPNDFIHKFGKRSQNVTKGIAVKISLQFDEYFSNFLHSNFYWYIRDFHYNLLSKAQSYQKNIIFFQIWLHRQWPMQAQAPMATWSLLRLSSSPKPSDLFSKNV